MAGSSYLPLLRSTAALFVEEPILRERALFALLIFANLNVFWTSVVLPLSAPPLSLSHTMIGLLGVAGFAGALGARNAGRLADLGGPERTTGLSLMLMLAAWVAIACLHTSLWLLVAGVLMLDLALQAVHVTNQSLIVAARPDARAGWSEATWCSTRSVAPLAGSPRRWSMRWRAGSASACSAPSISAGALLVWVITASRMQEQAGCALTRLTAHANGKTGASA